MRVKGLYILFNSPVHQQVGAHKRGENVKDLAPKSSPGIEDGGMGCPGKRPLPVCRDGVGGDTFLCLRPCTWRDKPCEYDGVEIYRSIYWAIDRPGQAITMNAENLAKNIYLNFPTLPEIY
jgi:hypothetical protein